MDNAWEAIVSADTFDRVQKILRSRSFVETHPRRTSSSYVLSKLLKCKSCGKRMSGQEAKSGRYSYYVCGSLLKQGRGACETPYLSARKLESRVVDRIKDMVLTDQNLTELIKLVNEEMEGATGDLKDNLSVIQTELADVQSRLDRLYETLETGKLNLDDLYPRIQRLRHRQDQLQASQDRVEGLLEDERPATVDASEIVQHVEEMRSILDEGSVAQRRSFIASFVEEIEISGRNATVRYVLPMPQGTNKPDRNEEVRRVQEEVLRIVQSGGEAGTRTRTPFST